MNKYQRHRARKRGEDIPFERSGQKPIDLTGQNFGHLKAIKFFDIKDRRARWLCDCDCGKQSIVSSWALRSGHTKSCGCRQNIKPIRKHGHAKRHQTSKEYIAWTNAVKRCHNPKDKKWKHYGGRGITMCKEWKDNFSAFIAYMGRCPPGLTLDRYPNNNGNYEPGNVRWTSYHEQNLNRRRLPRIAPGNREA